MIAVHLYENYFLKGPEFIKEVILFMAKKKKKKK